MRNYNIRIFAQDLDGALKDRRLNAASLSASQDLAEHMTAALLETGVSVIRPEDIFISERISGGQRAVVSLGQPFNCEVPQLDHQADWWVLDASGLDHRLWVLQAMGVGVVLAGQAVHADGQYQYMRDDLPEAMRKFFPKSADDILERTKRLQGQLPPDFNSGASKNVLLECIAKSESVEPTQIALNDDSRRYREPTEEFGATFLQASTQRFNDPLLDDAETIAIWLSCRPAADVQAAVQSSGDLAGRFLSHPLLTHAEQIFSLLNDTSADKANKLVRAKELLSSLGADDLQSLLKSLMVALMVGTVSAQEVALILSAVELVHRDESVKTCVTVLEKIGHPELNLQLTLALAQVEAYVEPEATLFRGRTFFSLFAQDEVSQSLKNSNQPFVRNWVKPILDTLKLIDISSLEIKINEPGQSKHNFPQLFALTQRVVYSFLENMPHLPQTLREHLRVMATELQSANRFEEKAKRLLAREALKRQGNDSPSEEEITTAILGLRNEDIKAKAQALNEEIVISHLFVRVICPIFNMPGPCIPGYNQLPEPEKRKLSLLGQMLQRVATGKEEERKGGQFIVLDPMLRQLKHDLRGGVAKFVAGLQREYEKKHGASTDAASKQSELSQTMKARDRDPDEDGITVAPAPAPVPVEEAAAPRPKAFAYDPTQPLEFKFKARTGLTDYVIQKLILRYLACDNFLLGTAKLLPALTAGQHDGWCHFIGIQISSGENSIILANNKVGKNNLLEVGALPHDVNGLTDVISYCYDSAQGELSIRIHVDNILLATHIEAALVADEGFRDLEEAEYSIMQNQCHPYYSNAEPRSGETDKPTFEEWLRQLLTYPDAIEPGDAPVSAKLLNHGYTEVKRQYEHVTRQLVELKQNLQDMAAATEQPGEAVSPRGAAGGGDVELGAMPPSLENDPHRFEQLQIVYLELMQSSLLRQMQSWRDYTEECRELELKSGRSQPEQWRFESFKACADAIIGVDALEKMKGEQRNSFFQNHPNFEFVGKLAHNLVRMFLAAAAYAAGPFSRTVKPTEIDEYEFTEQQIKAMQAAIRSGYQSTGLYGIVIFSVAVVLARNIFSRVNEYRLARKDFNSEVSDQLTEGSVIDLLRRQQEDIASAERDLPGVLKELRDELRDIDGILRPFEMLLALLERREVDLRVAQKLSDQARQSLAPNVDQLVVATTCDTWLVLSRKNRRSDKLDRDVTRYQNRELITGRQQRAGMVSNALFLTVFLGWSGYAINSLVQNYELSPETEEETTLLQALSEQAGEIGMSLVKVLLLLYAALGLKDAVNCVMDYVIEHRLQLQNPLQVQARGSVVSDESPRAEGVVVRASDSRHTITSLARRGGDKANSLGQPLLADADNTTANL